jgi:hypothetical protein
MKKADTSRPQAPKPFSIFRAAISLAFGPGRPVLILLLLVGLLVGAWYIAWQFVGPRVLADPRYRMTAEDVEITPLPPWIHSDVRGEAIRGITLSGSVSIMTDELTQRVADAFGLHPWVAKVVAVRKFHPARVKVELEYRRPVLMVEVPGGLLPVDVQGAWLPSGDFSPIEANGYPRLVGINSAPVGPVGTRWGDARVVGAAEIAAAIGPAWSTLGLQRIATSAASISTAGEEYTYEVTTRGESRVLWGHSPGGSGAGEVPPAEKVARLQQYAAQHGSLDTPHSKQVLDLRGLRRLEVKP